MGHAVEVASQLVPEFEVIVVEDGSSDGSLDVLRRLQTQHRPHLRILAHHTNRGYGGALRTGFAGATGSLIFLTDSDNQFDLRELRYFLSLIDHFDMVIGFRIHRHDPVLRGVVSWVYNGSSGYCSGCVCATSTAPSS